MKQFRLIVVLLSLAFGIKAQAPIANFSTDQLVICVGESVNFTNLTNNNGQSIISTNWNFGEGSTSTQSSPSHAYLTSGVFSVILTVITSGGTDTEDKTAYITVNPLPSTNFTISGDNCNLPYTGVITNTSSTGANFTYNWSYSNGQTSTLKNPPNFTSNSAGNYTITLDVINTTTGCINTKTTNLPVNNYQAAITAPSTACYLDPVTVHDASTSGTNNWVWVAGNGQTSSAQNPTFNYTVPGTYNLQLTAQNTTIGCSRTISQNITVKSLPSPSFTKTPSSGCAPLSVGFSNTSAAGNFQWNFGNGNSYTGTNPPNQTYTTNGNFVVSLTMNSTQGCMGTAIITDTIKIASPTPFIKANRRGGCSPLTVQFEDSSYTTNPTNDPIISWVWDLGDGSTYNGQTPPPHVYTIGKYNITLTVTTQNGCINSTLYPNYIKVGTIDDVNFSEVPNIGCARKDYVFTNLSTITAPHSQSDVTYKWDFGDGGKSVLENPIYNFPIDTGFFDVKLIVNFNGCIDSLIKTDQIYIKTPISKFRVDTLICNPNAFPLRVPVKDLSTLGVSGDDIDMIWRWEGTTEYKLNSAELFDSNKGDTAYYFNNYGSYKVKQIINNNTIGCGDSTEQTIVISKLVPNFTISSDTLCQAEPIVLNSTSDLTNGPGFFSFNMGNGIVKNGNPIVYTYTNSGNYNITLKAFNNAGCIATVAKNNLIIISTPSASFTASASGDQCLPLVNNYINTSVNSSPIDHFKWTLPDGTIQNTFTKNETVSFTHDTIGVLSTSLIAYDIYGCQSNPSLKTVSITKPEINFIMDSVYCNNTSLFVQNNTIGFGNLSYDWRLDDVNFSTDTNFRKTFNENNISGNLFTNHLVSLIVTDQKGCKDSIDHSIYIALPNLDFGYIPTGATINANGEYLCPPVFGNFSDSSLSYGNITNWNWTFGDGKSSNLKNPSNTYLYPGTYSVGIEITDEFGCIDDTLLVDYIKILGPTVNSNWINTGTSCGNEYLFTATNFNPINTLLWDLNDGTNYSDSIDFLYSYNSGIFTPKVTVTDPIGCAVIYELPAISVNASNFTADAGQDIIVCTDQTNLNAVPKTDNSYSSKWIVVSGSIIINDPTSPTSSVSNLGTSENIIVWKISDGCIYVTDTISVINGFSNVNAGQDDATCSYSYSNLSANSPFVGIGSWSSPDNSIVFINPLDSLTSVSNLKNGNNTLIWTINSICGVNSDTTIIFVETPPTTSNAGQNDSICGDQINLNGNIPTVGTGTWSLISGTGTITNPSSPTSLVTNIGKGLNIFEWKIENNCNFSSSQVTIKGVEQPTVAVCYNDTIFCADNHILIADTNLIGEGIWTIGKGAGLIEYPNLNETNVTALDIDTNVFKWTIANYCNSTYDSVIVIREALPTLPILTNDTSTCENSIQLLSNAPYVGIGEWSIVSSPAPLPSKTDTTSITFTNLAIGQNTFGWTISNTCESNTEEIIVELIDAPSIAIVEADQSLCVYTSTINASVPLVGTGIWELFSGSGTFENPINPTTNVTDIGEGINLYTWTVSNICGSNTDTLIVAANIAPTTAEVGSDQTICGGLTILSGNTPTVGNGVWSIVDGNGFFHTTSDPTTGVDSIGIGENTYVWTISNACTSTSAEIKITNTGQCIDEDSLLNILYYYVPNSFSPNGDDMNNLFSPVFESGFEPLKYSLLIFNRWGQLIFESYNADYGWNGKLSNGEEVQSGIYPWKITFTDIITQTERVLNGFVVLVR